MALQVRTFIIHEKLFKPIKNPQINYEQFFEVMRDFRKGGLCPTMYDEFLKTVKQLPNHANRQPSDYIVFDKFNLTDISEDDFTAIIGEIIKRGIEKSKICWHPEASNTTCNIDCSGKIIVSAAHSIQNNGILNKIVDNGHVTTFAFDNGDIKGKSIGRHYASIFWGFCNTHDSIFKPIEICNYLGTEEQHFLFAYRGFVVGAHKKLEVSTWMNYGDQSQNDIKENKRIFDTALLNSDYTLIETEVFELPAFYPIAVSSMFYLDYDFEGNIITHSDDRMEFVFVTLLPTDNKTYFLLSYLKTDKNLYGALGKQLRNRNKYKSDISILLAAHTGNIYFNPVYYKTFIEQQEEKLIEILVHSQLNLANEKDPLNLNFSLTPNNYLDNPYKINLFGY